MSRSPELLQEAHKSCTHPHRACLLPLCASKLGSPPNGARGSPPCHHKAASLLPCSHSTRGAQGHLEVPAVPFSPTPNWDIWSGAKYRQAEDWFIEHYLLNTPHFTNILAQLKKKKKSTISAVCPAAILILLLVPKKKKNNTPNADSQKKKKLSPDIQYLHSLEVLVLLVSAQRNLA